MIIRIFRGQQPVSHLVLGLLVIALWTLGYLRGNIVAGGEAMPLYQLLVSGLNPGTAILYFFAGALLTVFQGMRLNKVINRHEVLLHRSHVPGLLFVLTASAIPELVTFSPAVVVNTILVLVLDKIFRLYKNDSPHSLVFDSCLLLSLASLFYLPSALFIIWFFAGLLILRPFSWRDWAVGLAGVLTPLFFYLFYCFMTDRLAGAFVPFQQQVAGVRFDFRSALPSGYPLLTGWMAVLLFISGWTIRARFTRNVARIRNFQSVIFIACGVSLGLILLTPATLYFRYGLACMPLAVMLSFYFLEARKVWLAELFIYLFIAIAAFNFTVGRF